MRAMYALEGIKKTMTEAQTPGGITPYTCPPTVEAWPIQHGTIQIEPISDYNPERPQPPQIFAERALTAQDGIDYPTDIGPIVDRFRGYLGKQLKLDPNTDPTELKLASRLMYGQQLSHACLGIFTALSLEPQLRKRIDSLDTKNPLPLATDIGLSEYQGGLNLAEQPPAFATVLTTVSHQMWQAMLQTDERIRQPDNPYYGFITLYDKLARNYYAAWNEREDVQFRKNPDHRQHYFNRDISLSEPEHPLVSAIQEDTYLAFQAAVAGMLAFQEAGVNDSLEHVRLTLYNLDVLSRLSHLKFDNHPFLQDASNATDSGPPYTREDFLRSAAHALTLEDNGRLRWKPPVLNNQASPWQHPPYYDLASQQEQTDTKAKVRYSKCAGALALYLSTRTIGADYLRHLESHYAVPVLTQSQTTGRLAPAEILVAEVAITAAQVLNFAEALTA